MPLYEYKCSSCGTHFEVLTGLDDAVVCDSCGSGKVEKKFSSFAVHAGSQPAVPDCSSGCGGGFDQGSCGSGMCGGR